MYSDLAITVCLMLGMVYKKPLRQTEGFERGFVRLMRLDVFVPEFSTFSRRCAQLILLMKSRDEKDGPIHLLVDSTGLKIFGEGEWLQNKHKTKSQA
ncbi:MAG: transposase [Octadecabacter sp.]|nr:transposase [Octadecabacter sp.]